MTVLSKILVDPDDAVSYGQQNRGFAAEMRLRNTLPILRL